MLGLVLVLSVGFKPSSPIVHELVLSRGCPSCSYDLGTSHRHPVGVWWMASFHTPEYHMF